MIIRPIKLIRSFARLFGPPGAEAEFSRPAPDSLYIATAAIAIMTVLALAVGYWVSAKMGWAAIGALIVVGIGAAIRHSRKQHLAYEAVLAAERAKARQEKRAT